MYTEIKALKKEHYWHIFMLDWTVYRLKGFYLENCLKYLLEY